MNDLDRAKRQFREYYDANIALWRDAEKSLRAQVLGVLADQPAFATPHVVSRVKAREECINKFQRKYLARLAAMGTPYAIADYIGDLIGIRVICLYEPDIKEIAHLLGEEFDLLDVTDKAREVEVTADTFRYKGLHLDMALSERRRSLPAYSRFASVRFEVQVRTAIQDAWSTLDHAIEYKKEVPLDLSRRINALAALFEVADHEFLAIRNEIANFAPGTASTNDQAAAGGHRSTASEFRPVLCKHFPHFRFDDRQLRGFVDELQFRGPPVSPADLAAALAGEAALLRDYARHQWSAYRESLNPLTLVRHALYLRDPTAHANALSDAQRAKLDEWRKGDARWRFDAAEIESGARREGGYSDGSAG